MLAALPPRVGWVAKRAYWLLSMRWPASVSDARWRWITRSPQTYLEKLRYKMARDRRQLLTTLADKLAARDYVSQRVGESRLLKVYAESRTAAGIPWATLPREYVVKVNHGSGGVIVVSEAADREARLPPPGLEPGWSSFHIHSDVAEPADLARTCDHWLGLPYRWKPGRYLEWAYSNITPRVFVEEFAGGKRGLARNVKIHCFHGVPTTILISSLSNEFAETVEQRFLMSESRAAADLAGLDEATMRELVEDTTALAAETDLVRIDWLLTPGGPRFGEFTNYPGGGWVEPGGALSLSPAEVAALYAEVWHVPCRYR